MPRLIAAPAPPALLLLAALVACSSPKHNPAWVGGLPVLADINRDGVEDLLADRDGLQAIDGRTLKPLWHRRDLGFIRNGGSRAVAFAGDAVVAPRDRELQLLRPSDGATLLSIPLSDKVAALCADGAQLWVRTIDEVSGVIELPATGVAAAAPPQLRAGQPPPAGCARARLHHGYACDHAAARCEHAGSDLSMALTDEATAPPTRITVDIKHPGTPEVSFILADGKRLLFDREGARVHAADLAGGRLFLKRLGTIAAFDAATGAPLWTTHCSGNTPFLRATATRVYAECSGPRQYLSLRVLDHAGASLLEFGEPRG
jgi:hypothetical protein